MDDFRLKVFITAARTLSFTRTAERLFISQPAVSKHIGELESQYKVQLFMRRGSRLELTGAGETLLACAERLADDYRRMQYEMSLCADAPVGELRLGASTTIAQYLLPPILARFTTRFPGVRVAMMSGNSDQVEQALGGHGIDLGMVESLSRRQGLHYTVFAPDELVLVARTGGPYSRTESITFSVYSNKFYSSHRFGSTSAEYLTTISLLNEFLSDIRHFSTFNTGGAGHIVE